MKNEKFTPGPWYAVNSAGDHQGLVISETTGKTIALTYDPKDKTIVSKAPEMFEALNFGYQALKDIINAAGNGEPYSAQELADFFIDKCNDMFDVLSAIQADYE